METIDQLLYRLSKLDIKIWAEEERLRCNAPKGMLTQDLRAELSARKSEILAFLGSNRLLAPGEHAEVQGQPRIEPVERRGPPPLSFAQQRLWFLDQLEEANRAYTLVGAIQLRGGLNVPLLERCFAQIVQRHEVLRTTFPVVDGQPVQSIAESLEIAIEVVDLRAVPEVDKRKRVDSIVAAQAKRPFDLMQGPLLRLQLLHVGPSPAGAHLFSSNTGDAEHVLIVTLHHIIADGWSFGLLIQEISELYAAALAGERASLAALPIQYADFAHWQRERVQSGALAGQLAYWQRQLKGAPAQLELPTDHARPPVQRFEGLAARFEIEGELLDSLTSIGKRAGASLFMTLYAAFAAFLARYSGQDDLVVGTPIANRNRPEIEPLIGFFVNMLPLRTDLSGTPSFVELLSRVRGMMLEAYDHQDVPFERLVDAVQADRNLSHSPLFQVMFVWQETMLASHAIPGLELRALETDQPGAQFDLTLVFETQQTEHSSQASRSLKGRFEYNTDLFEPATIRRMIDHFRTLLRAIAAQPSTPIAQLPLMSASQRRHLLEEWNRTEIEFPDAERCLHELVEAQVARTPHAVAVRFEGRTLTYRALNQWANRLAGHLRRLGVGPGSSTAPLVGILAERSLELVAAVLGVLKAGGAYVPLDPGYPPERLRFMIEDSRTPVLLTQAHLRTQLAPELEDQVDIVCLDSDWSDDADPELHDLHVDISVDDLAYVIYTSGSTGRPKGVEISHRAIGNRLRWMQATYPLLPTDKVLQKTPFSFDASVWELLLPLQTGAQLVLARPDGHKDSNYLTAAIREEEITILQGVPSMYRMLVEDPGFAHCTSLRRLFSAGEALPMALARRVLDLLSPRPGGVEGVELVNTYGPTEASIDVTHWRCDPAAPYQIAPIGRPIANTRIYILDRYLQPTPVGVAGELHIDGTGLARGYLGRPELTREKFVPNPLQQDAARRLYKSGDRVRYLPDGNIEFLGRLDSQVKIRGYRIEIGEIEAALTAHPAVRHAVVLVHEVGLSKQLAAYVVPRALDGEPGAVIADIRTALTQKLPDYMTPGAIMLLDELPLLPNGKIDRQALPAPEHARAEKAYVAPQTETERLLAKVWGEILGIKRVGSEDNFFALGGDSIACIQVVNRAREQGLSLNVQDVFQRQSLAELAAGVTVGAEPVHDHAQQGLVSGDVPLTPIQTWFFEQQLRAPHQFNQSVLLQAHDAIDERALQIALQALATHHDALRLRFERSAGDAQWVQHCTEDVEGASDLVQVDLRQCAEPVAQARLHAEIERAQSQLALKEGPLLRAVIFRQAGREPDQLLLVIHHLVVDGVSWRILLEDLQAAYRQAQLGTEIGLPPKSSSFKAWAERLHRHVHEPAIQAELPYWLALVEELDGTSGAARIFSPGDGMNGAAPANTVGSEQTVTLALDAQWARRLLKASGSRFSVNELLLTALVRSFSAQTGHDRLLVDLEGHGREELFDDLDVSRTVGWFTTIHPLLLKVEGLKGDHDATLKAVRGQLRAVPNRGIGYGLLRYLAPGSEAAARLAAQPASDIVFNYLGQFNSGQEGANDFRLLQDSAPAERNPLDSRPYLLEVNCLLIEGELQARWSYSTDCHAPEMIEQWAASFIAELKALIVHCADQPEADPALEQRLPLSFAQERLWFQEQLDGVSAAYNISKAVSLRGRFDMAAAEAAYSEIVRRHASLRTNFLTVDDRPMQQIAATRQAVIKIVDLRDQAAGDAEVRSALIDESQQPFDISKDPLVRVVLYQLPTASPGEQDAQLAIQVTMHHIITDGWSMGLFYHEFAQLYAAFVAGKESPLAELPIQYVDYAQRQRKTLTGAVLAEQLAYWQSKLRDLPTLELPMARPRPAAPAFKGGRRLMTLDASHFEQLQQLSRRYGATLFMTVTAALHALFHWYSGQLDIVVGTDIANRSHRQNESLIGFFVNQLVLRTDLSGDPTFVDLLKRFQTTALEAYAHQELPFERLVQALNPKRERGVTPLFQVKIAGQNAPEQSIELPGLQLEPLNFHSEMAKFDLLINIWPQPTQMIIDFEYNADLFDDGVIVQMIALFQSLLTAVLSDPEQRLSRLVATLNAEHRAIRQARRSARGAADQKKLGKIRRRPKLEAPNKESI